MENIKFRFANQLDKNKVKQFLAESDLPHEDIATHLSNVILAEHNGQLVGNVGLEILDKAGLLRSLAVKDSYRKKGLGINLMHRIIIHAQHNKIKKLFLLTTTAPDFFYMHSFGKIDRERTPQSIQETQEFKDICPASAVCMSREI